MPIDSVGYAFAFAPARNPGLYELTPEQRKINPFKDKVYYDRTTGEYTTWKPGLIAPKKEKPTNWAIPALAGAAAIALAVIFRKPLAKAVSKVLKIAQPYVQKAFAKSVEYTKKAIEIVKPYAKKVYDAVKPYVAKVSDFIKNTVFKPVVAYVKG